MNLNPKPLASALVLALLSGCGADSDSSNASGGPVPAAIASDLAMVDTEPQANLISGTFLANNPSSPEVIRYFSLFLSEADGRRSGEEITRFDFRPEGDYQVELNQVAIQPDQQLLLVAGNDSGLALQGATLANPDRSRPADLQAVTNAKFMDSDFNPLSIAGQLSFDEPDNNESIGEYHIYLAEPENQKPLEPLFSVSAGLGDYQLLLEEPLTITANSQFLIYAANEMGDQLTPVSVPASDLIDVQNIEYQKVPFDVEDSEGWVNVNGDKVIESPFPIFIFGELKQYIKVCEDSGIFVFKQTLDCGSDEILDFIDGLADVLPQGYAYIAATGFDMSGIFAGHRYDYQVIGEKPNRELIINVQDQILTPEQSKEQAENSFAYFQIRFKEQGEIEIHSELIEAKRGEYDKIKQRVVHSDRSQEISYQGDERGSRWSFNYSLENDAIRFTTNKPVNAPELTVSDLHYQRDGLLTWVGSTDETDLAGYYLYYLDADMTQLNDTPVLLSISDSSANIPYAQLPANTQYFRVYGVNLAGESEAYLDYELDLSIPAVTLTDAEFVDKSGYQNSLSGDLSWTAPVDESNVSGYRIYFGSSEQNRVGNALATVAAGIGRVQIGTQVNSQSHFLIYAYNELGEAEQPSAAVAFTDHISYGVRNLTFIDEDPDANEISGLVKWQAPAENDHATSYRIYFSNSVYYPDGPLIGEVATDGELTFDIPVDTPIAAQYLIVYSMVYDSRGESGVVLPISDYALPTITASNIKVFDDDQQAGAFNGRVEFEAASDETHIKRYNLYWGSSEDVRGTLFASVDKGEAYSVAVELASIAPENAFIHIYAENDIGEGSQALVRPIADAPYPIILVEYKNEMKTFHTVAGRGDELCESRLNEEDVRMTAGGARYNGVALLSRDGQNAKDVVPQSEWHRPVVGPKAPLVDSWQGLWQNDHPAGGVYSENDFATAGVAVYDTVMFWFGADNTGTTSENCQNWNQYASDVKHTLLHGQGNRIGLYDFHGQTTFGCTNSRRFLCVIY